ncbi:ankyrin repeat and death domain-containing protein 1A-like [Centruroides sculpturatus]|uniref:ankyrin repeat and death domain-containing protein 1A-like n=1 Tax=Centruroides sculpturatus TaxID=218467 RepID=UPI000C6E57A4|nr:ankyrin repeat and death domain-containing protein 1A-like [Centruroides sculpturatus]
MEERANESSDRRSKRSSLASSKAHDIDLVSLQLSHSSRGVRQELLLHEAAIKNDLAVAKKLIEAKVDVNAKGHMDRTPVHWAASKGHLDILATLIHAKCDIEATDKYGMRPVLMAAWFGHKGAVQLLVENGANCRAVNRQGQTVLHCGTQNSNVEIVNFLIESVENIQVNTVDKNGQTALHIAAMNNCMEITEKLIQAGADVSIKDKMGRTAVHLAALKGHHLILVRLLRVGVEIDDRDEEGKTSLHLSAESGHKEAAEILLQHNCDPEAEDTKERTALHIAASLGHADVVTTLLNFGASLNVKEKLDTIQIYNLDKNILTNSTDAKWTNTNKSVVKEYSKCNEIGYLYPNPGLYAIVRITSGDPIFVVVDLLDIAEEEEAAAVTGGLTPASPKQDQKRASRRRVARKGDSVEDMGKYYPQILDFEYNIKKKITSNTSNIRLQTALHLAAELGYAEVTEVLLSCGANLSIPEKGGRKPLYIAARGSYTAIVDMLIRVEREQNLKFSPSSDFLESQDITVIQQAEEQAEAQQKRMRQLLWSLANNYLEAGEWRRLARYWGFTEEHIKAIEHQYTGKNSYKEHGYRMLLIWLHGVPSSRNTLKELFEALVAIDKREIAGK